MNKTEPRCPKCSAEGIQHFASRESSQRSRSRDPWFFVIYCDQCGHVYNVLAKHVFSEQTTRFVVPDES